MFLRTILLATLFSALTVTIVGGVAAAPPRSSDRTATPPRSIPRPTARPAIALATAPGQFRDAASNLPGWLVELELSADASRNGLRRARGAIDAVLRDANGIAGVTQRYEYALVGFAAFMSPADAGALLADPRVQRVEPDLICRASASPGDPSDEGYVVDPDLNGPWGLLRISDPDGLAPKYDPCGADGAGVTVAVIDSGITPNHTEFGDRIVAMENFNPNESDAIDEATHGTHVAGTIAGETVGVAPAADIAALRVFGADNTGPTSAIIAALNWAANPSNLPLPAVANMSLEGPSPGPTAFIYFQALDAVQRRGIPIVAAAGNFSHPARWAIPGNSASTITAGAMGIGDRAAVFSNHGPTVDIWAPGVNILSADANHPDGGLKVDSGTSMAAPMTTGVLALHLQRHPPHPSTEAPEGRFLDAVRRTLSLIAAGAEGRLSDWENPDVVAVGSNGALAGAANRLLQTCDADVAPGCDEPISWRGDAASIVLGDGIEPLVPGFTCSRVIAHPSKIVELTIQAPALLPVVGKDENISDFAADIMVTDLSTGQSVWLASESWFLSNAYDRSANRRLTAGGLQGFRVDWVSYHDDLPGGYGYAMTATIPNLQFRPAGPGERGTVGGNELGQMLAAWGPCVPEAPCPTDLDGDGTTGLSDLEVLLSVWGTIPAQVQSGFILDCEGNQVPGAWVGDEYLDAGDRVFMPDPFLTPSDVRTVNLDCERLEWDAPLVGTIASQTDPRIGAGASPSTGTCVESDYQTATANGRIFFGHGTTCSQLGPVTDQDTWCSGDRVVGDPSKTGGNPDWFYVLVRQPLPPDVRSVTRITALGNIGLRAFSRSNLNPIQYGKRWPAFTGDLRITVALDDGTTRSVTRSPELGLFADTVTSVAYRYLSAEGIHDDDGRNVESICLTMASQDPGLSMTRALTLLTSTLDEDDPGSGAEYSPDNGRTWYPLVDSNGQRVQVVLCVDSD